MKFCGQCGAEVPADDRFCGSCGHELGRQTASSPPEPARTRAPEIPTTESRSSSHRYHRLWHGDTEEAAATESLEQIMRKVTCPHCHDIPPSSDGRTECEFCDDGFIEELVALSPAGRAGLQRTSKRFEHPKPVEDPKPGVSVGTKQNRPVVGAILGLISLAPAVVTGLFIVLFVLLEFDADVLPLPVALYVAEDHERQPLIWFLVGCATSLLGWVLVMRTCFPERDAKQKMIRKQRKAKDVTPEKITTWDRVMIIGVVFSVIVGLSTMILYWINTPPLCVVRVTRVLDLRLEREVCNSDGKILAGIFLGFLAGFVVMVAAAMLAQAVRRRRMTPEEVAASQAAAEASAKIVHEKQRQMGWDSVPKVVCPHCQKAGGVQHFTPYEAPRDLLKEGLMWHLTGKTIGHVEVTPAEKIGRDIREASQKAQTPNMRCTNCTIDWRV